jgi:hypothetical protein
MSKRSVKKHNRKPDSVKITFKGSVAAGQEKAKQSKLANLIKKVPELVVEPGLEVHEDDTDHGEAFHVHSAACSHSE